MGRVMVDAILAEYDRYRELGTKALAQVAEEKLWVQPPGKGNSLVVLVQHMSGNFRSRFTDFLTSDGEKEWRSRDDEFTERRLTRAEIDKLWNDGWSALHAAVRPLTDADLSLSVKIRGRELSVLEALLRSVAHASHHVGQIIYLGKMLRGEEWENLSIPPGGSAAYNRNPTREKPPRI